MSSLAPSSSVFFPPSPGLAHSLNSRGELGAFVNPHACSCRTCVDYVAERSAPEDHGDPPATPPPAPVASLAPSPPTLSCSLGLGLSMGWSAPSLSASAGGGAWAYPSLARSSSVAIEGWGGEELPAPPLARTVTGLGYTPTVAETDEHEDSEAAPPSLSLFTAPHHRELDHVDELMDRLRGLRSELQLAQDDVYRGTDHRSHDEMAAADMQFDEMDRQIAAIEQVMLSFGAIFRNR